MACKHACVYKQSYNRVKPKAHMTKIVTIKTRSRAYLLHWDINLKLLQMLIYTTSTALKSG